MRKEVQTAAPHRTLTAWYGSLICVRPIVMKIQRIITYLGSVLLVALSQINVSFSHTFC